MGYWLEQSVKTIDSSCIPYSDRVIMGLFQIGPLQYLRSNPKEVFFFFFGQQSKRSLKWKEREEVFVSL